jgi:hypothetical protein
MKTAYAAMAAPVHEQSLTSGILPGISPAGMLRNVARGEKVEVCPTDQNHLGTAKQNASPARSKGMTPPRPLLTEHLRRVRQLAGNLLVENDLEDCRFRFGSMKSRLGAGDAHALFPDEPSVIELNRAYAEFAPLDEVREALLHYICHVISEERGHAGLFGEAASEMGISPDPWPCQKARSMRGRWQARCPTCGQLFFRQTAPTGRPSHCSLCPSSLLKFALAKSEMVA